jgi:hypothetical protein
MKFVIGKGNPLMLKTIYIPLFAIVFTLSACSQGNPVSPSPTSSATISPTPISSPTPTPSSGIEGYVWLGPMCGGPVRAGTNDCPDQPYQATITILESNGTQVAQFQSDQNGYFKITLSPGTYTIHPVSGKPLPRAIDQTVVVNNGQFTQITINFDTGMR